MLLTSEAMTLLMSRSLTRGYPHLWAQLVPDELGLLPPLPTKLLARHQGPDFLISSFAIAAISCISSGPGLVHSIFWDGCTVSVNTGCRAASSSLGTELDELALPFQGFLNKQPAAHHFERSEINSALGTSGAVNNPSGDSQGCVLYPRCWKHCLTWT